MTRSSNNLIKRQSPSAWACKLSHASCLKSLTVDILYSYIISIMLKQKHHEQVKKHWNEKMEYRNAALVMKQCRNVYDVLAM